MRSRSEQPRSLPPARPPLKQTTLSRSFPTHLTPPEPRLRAAAAAATVARHGREGQGGAGRGGHTGCARAGQDTVGIIGASGHSQDWSCPSPLLPGEAEDMSGVEGERQDLRAHLQP